MPITYGLPTNYQSPLTALPSEMQFEPVEGRLQVPVEILWGVMGGASHVVGFNLQNNATLNISQIGSLKVDNSQSAAPITIIFPDTGDQMVIAAGTKLVVFPVFSNGLQFVVSAPTAIGTDVTRLQILNYVAQPVLIP
jgi:hypothetical protein